MRLRYRYQFAHFYYSEIRFSLRFLFFFFLRHVHASLQLLRKRKSVMAFFAVIYAFAIEDSLIPVEEDFVAALCPFPIVHSVGCWCWNTLQKKKRNPPSTEDALLELDFIHVKCILNLFSSKRNAVTSKRGHIFGDAWK